MSFGPETSFAVSPTPSDVEMGDFNRDGVLDLVVTNQSVTFDVSVLLGTGTGTFGAATNFAVGNAPTDTEIGDFNRDGILDLVVANNGSNNVSVLLGTGTGTFAAATNFAAGTNPHGVAIGDLNGDGILDLAVANQFSNDVVVLLGTGTGSFGAATGFATGQNARDVDIGDFNGDGIMDLAVVNFVDDNVSVLLGTGTGAFGAATNFPTGNAPNGISIGDLNGDGILDLAVANQTSSDIGVLLGTGTGTFGAVTNFPMQPGTSEVEIGDLNGDGIPDLVSPGGSGAVVREGTGGGAFGSSTLFTIGSTPRGIAIGDLDGDGRPDLAVPMESSFSLATENVSVLLNTTTFAPAGVFGTATTYIPGATPLGVALGDLDQDGILDLVAANATISASSVSVQLGTGTGTFGTATNFFGTGIGPVGVSIGDLNEDGIPDLAVANSADASVSVLLGSGGGGFVLDANYGMGGNLSGLAIGDLNRDGSLDVVATNISSGSVGVRLGTGTGSLGTLASFGSAPAPSGVAIGDVNRDGIPDLAVSDQISGPGNVSVFLGTGTGAFGTATTFSAGTDPSGIAIGDLNRDGIPDLAVANSTSNDVSILLGTGTGTFGTATNFTTGTTNLRGVAIGDFNRDGIPDLAVPNELPISGDVSVLLGTGTGAFGTPTIFPAGTPLRSIATGDLNRDGKMDLVMGGNVEVAVLLNSTAPNADLVVTATASSNPVLINDPFTYTITVTNNGPDDVDVTIEDTLHPGTTFIPNGVVPTGPTPSDADCGGTSPTILCGPRTVNNGNSTQFFIAVSAPGSPTALLNTVEVTSDVNDPDPGTPLTAQTTTIVQSSASPTADLLLTITDSPDPAILGGGFITYTMTVQNNGPDVATDVQVTGAFTPTGVTVDSIIPNVPSFSCVGVGVDCLVGNIDPTSVVKLTVNVTPATVGTVTLTGNAQSTGTLSVPDPNSVNNTDITETTSVGTNIFTVTSNDDVNDATCSASPGHCSLREAIIAANGAAGLDIIQFNISPAGVQTISPLSALPLITDPVVIDGTTQPGFVGIPIIELNGSSAGNANGLQLAGGNSTVRRLVINNFTGDGIFISAGSGNAIEGNYVGTDVTGSLDEGNGGAGIRIFGSTNNTIGGTTSGARNIISGNDGVGGVAMTGPGATGNFVQGNYIGTDVTGTVDLGNALNGVVILDVPSNTIGGTTVEARNIISGNDFNGVNIAGAGGTGNLVQGNYIGTNAAGMAALGNGAEGILLIGGATNNTIGGTTPGARNVISGHTTTPGIRIQGATTSANTVAGNFIGITASGLSAIPNNQGVSLGNSTFGNTIGGTDPAARNIISGNVTGVSVGLVGINNAVHGNYIGTNPAGTAALANGTGVVLDNGATDVTIGGANATPGGNCTGACNVISGNGTGISLLNNNTGANGNFVQGNYIGLNAAGTGAVPNTDGVFITGVFGNMIGGDNALPGTGCGGACNIISGNGNNGVFITGSATGNFVAGNVIGLNAVGVPLGNIDNGVEIVGANATNNLIGRTTPARRNVISANGDGVQLTNGGLSGNSIVGNFIGTDLAGNNPLGNTNDGIRLEGSGNNRIGGTVGKTPGVVSCTGECNVISGNLQGINIVSAGTFTADNNQIVGNFVGTNVAGDTAVPNNFGIVMNNAPTGTMVGGTTPEATNVISGNLNNGITITQNASVNTVQGNYIGINAAGTAAVRNGVNGVHILAGASSNVIGGPTAAARNIIAGNGTVPDPDPLNIHIGNGVLIQDSGTTGNVVQGNYIGTDVTGLNALGNVKVGVGIYDSASNNIIGGSAAGAANLVSGNVFHGVDIAYNAAGNIVLGNVIGLNATAAAPLGNGGVGVLLNFNALNNRVGGPLAGEANTISGNNAGVVVSAGTGGTSPATGTSILGNQIFGNMLYGIDLVAIGDPVNGVTPNDAADGDTGANNLQNFPVLTSATAGASTTVIGSLNSTPSATFRVEFFSSPICDASGNGEGQTFLGFDTVTTDGAGDSPINVILASSTLVGEVVTATATNTATNDTSEFSACVTVGVPIPPGGFPITFDATALTAPQIQIKQGPTVLGTFNKSPQPTVGLNPGFYTLSSALTLEVTTTGGLITFEVTPAGTLDFDASLDGVLSGRGTATLVVSGVPITIDATDLVGRFFSMFGVLSTFSTGITHNVTVVPGQNEFHMTGQIPNFGFFFDVLVNGTVDFPAALDAYVSGRGTNTLTVTGFPITIDTSNLTAPQFGFPGNGPGINAVAGGVAVQLMPHGYNLASAVSNSFAGRVDMTVSTVGTITLADPSLQTNGIVSGDGTSTLTVTGIPLNVDATALTAGSLEFLGVNNVLPTHSGTQALQLMPGDHVVRQQNGIGGADFTFTADPATKTVAYAANLDVSQGGFLSGQGTTTLVIGGFPIQINATALSTATFDIPGTITGLDATVVQPLQMIPGDYQFNPATGTTFTFTVTPAGTIDFVPALDGFITGRGTNTLVINSDPGGAGLVFSVNSVADAIDANIGDGICETSAASECTFRAAIQEANATVGTDIIAFDISGGGLQTIIPGSALPSITDPVIIDGTTQPGFVGAPIIELNGAGAGATSHGLNISAGSTTVRGMVINRFLRSGIRVVGNGGNIFEGNYIGTDSTGTADLGNGELGIQLNTANNRIGGTTPAARNIIAGNTSHNIGIEGASATGNQVLGNYIGTDVTGTVALGNGLNGVHLTLLASGNTIGGTVAGSANVISGHTNGTGVAIGVSVAPMAHNNVVIGNYIGTDATGTVALPNSAGVLVSGNDNTVGGATAAARNVISGNTGYGIWFTAGGSGPAFNNVIQGNYIGTDVTGSVALGNGIEGVLFTDGANNNTIGGAVIGAGNVISGNGARGIQIGDGNANTVQGNFIGLNAVGTAALGNIQEGIRIATATNIIGGTTAAARNVISGNGSNGLTITSATATGNLVQGNYIGTDVTGVLSLGNSSSGVRLITTSNNIIGGTVSGARNVLSGNVGDGITLDTGSTGNVVQGNYIGVTMTGTLPLGNGNNGIDIL
ncbi:MAG: FG-GAP-like repeat-containing protein, partial [Nitrospirota bacterium]|nr:FG-GAP-like repeat-containing protein [Nitrospirota bacterium]